MTVKLTVDEIREAVRDYVQVRLSQCVKDVKVMAFESVTNGKMVIYAEAEIKMQPAPNGPYR